MLISPCNYMFITSHLTRVKKVSVTKIAQLLDKVLHTNVIQVLNRL